MPFKQFLLTATAIFSFIILTPAHPAGDNTPTPTPKPLPKPAPKPTPKTALSDTKDSKDTILRGIDISHFQGEIDWNKVKTNHPTIHFVYIKASEGTDLPDPRFESNRDNAVKEGFHWGAYHFFDFKKEPQPQADLFMQTVGRRNPGELPPWLDLESGKYSESTAVSPPTMRKHILIWLKLVESQLGVRPIIYASPNFIKKHLTDPVFADYRLASADYSTTQTEPVLTGAWKNADWTFWQYSQKGNVTGIIGTVDLNRFNGTLEDLSALTKKETPPKTPTPTPTPHPTPKQLQEYNLGRIYFPRPFIHNQKDYKKGFYRVTLILPEDSDTPLFRVYDGKGNLLFEEHGVGLPHKWKFKNKRLRVKKEMLKDYEFFRIRVYRSQEHFTAWFMVKKTKK